MHVTSSNRACWRVRAKFPPPRFAISAAGLWGPRPGRGNAVGEASLLRARLGLTSARIYPIVFAFVNRGLRFFESRGSALNKRTPYGIGKIANTLGRGHAGESEVVNKIDCRPGRAAPAIRPRGLVGNAFPPRGPTSLMPPRSPGCIPPGNKSPTKLSAS